MAIDCGPPKLMANLMFVFGLAARQLSAQVALFMSQVVVLSPGSFGVPVTGVLMSVAVEIDWQAETVGALGVMLLYIAASEKLA